MNSYFALTKTLIASLSMSKPQDKRRKVMIFFLSVFAVCGIMLPVAFLVGFFAKVTAEQLASIGCETFGIHFIFHGICLFTAIFGFHVVLNEFYFSNDIEYILPWPLRPGQIVASKFTAAFIGENIMQFIFIAACLIGFGLGTDMNLFKWVLSVFGVFTLTILPMVYTAILCMIIVCFTSFIKNKDMIQKITIFFVFAFLLFILVGAGSFKDIDFEQAVLELASGNQKTFLVLDRVFPNVPLFIQSIKEGNMLLFLIYLVLNVAAVGIMLLLAEALYMKGLIRLSSLPEKKKTKDLEQLVGKCKQHSPAYSYFVKEVKLLVRTPAFFTHSIVVNFIWPIFVFAAYKIQSRQVTIESLTRAYEKNESALQLLCLVFVVGISAFIASLNSISSNAISREGKHFPFMKYIPVSYEIQWNVKTLVGIVFAAAGVLIYVIPACVLIKVPVTHILWYIILCLLSVTFVSYMGIYIDSIQPKLVWDDEMSALRENYNMFYSMAIVIAFVAVVCVGGYFLLRNSTSNFGYLAAIFLLILAAVNATILLLMKKSGVRNIGEQEET